jgi:hypothetical protein
MAYTARVHQRQRMLGSMTMKKIFARAPSRWFIVAVMTLVPTVAFADAQADVQAAFDQVIRAGGFRAHASGRVFGPDLPAMSGSIEVVFPGRIHARTDAMEFIVTPQGAWASALGVWVPADRALLPVTAFDAAAMRKAIASIRDAHEEGTAKTSQCAARVYRFHASGQLPGADADGDMRIWICATSGKPARLEAIATGTRERLIIDFDWSRRAVVEAPEE